MALGAIRHYRIQTAIRTLAGVYQMAGETTPLLTDRADESGNNRENTSRHAENFKHPKDKLPKLQLGLLCYARMMDGIAVWLSVSLVVFRINWVIHSTFAFSLSSTK